MNEKAITAKIRAWLKRQPDVFCWKVLGTSNGIRGLPDICGNVGGSSLYLEVKTPRGRVSPSQEIVHQRIRGAGGRVFTVRSLEDAISAVESLR